MDFLPVIILYLEVILLAFAERKLWNTWFTPLNCLSVPYAVVLAICLGVDGNMGFVPFHYPSVWVWVVGLAVFFVPSCIWGLLQRRKNQNNREASTAKEFTLSPFTLRILEYITWGIFALFIFRFFHLAYAKDLMPGGENFAQEWAGHGFFGHLFTVLMGLTIFWMFAADKKHKRYWLYVLGFLGVALLYLSKCWFLVPMAGGLLLRLLTGKTKFGIKVILVSVFTGFAFFFASYWMTLYVASAENDVPTQRKKQTEYKAEVSSFIGKHAVTYIAAGVYGLSEDLAQNTLEYRDATIIYSPFINIGKILGDKNYISNINDQHVQITTHDSGSNVRSFFGSLYVYLGVWHAIAYTFIFSCLVYLLFMVARKHRHVFSLVIVGWIMGCLSMGWFDLYSTSLNFISIPCFLTAIFGFCYVWEHRKEIGKKIRSIKWITVRNIRRLLALLQVMDLSLLLLFFWAPWRLPSYFLGVSTGIAFVFLLTVPRRAVEFRFLKPYLSLFLLYLLYWISAVYSSVPDYTINRLLQQISVFLIPFIFWGMTPRFFSPRKIKWFGLCFIIGCFWLFFAKTAQLIYCFHIFWPYFKIHYVEAGITYMNTGSGFLYALNEFLSNQNIYFSWVFLRPIMHTTIEALLFNLSFALIFIAYVKKDPWLGSFPKKCLAVIALMFFAIALITSNSKTGQFLFLVNMGLLLVFCFRQKRWKTAGALSSLFLIAGIIGFHYFGMGISGRFSHSVNVIKEFRGNKEVVDDGSLLPRLYAWNTAIEMAKEKPVFGFGAGFMKDFIARCNPTHYPVLHKAYHHPHNQFLFVLVSNGIVGLCVFLLFWVQAVRLVWKNRRLWGWIWLLSLFAFCCIEVFFRAISFLYVCLPYCFLMVEYHNRKKMLAPAESLAPKP